MLHMCLYLKRKDFSFKIAAEELLRQYSNVCQGLDILKLVLNSKMCFNMVAIIYIPCMKTNSLTLTMVSYLD